MFCCSTRDVTRTRCGLNACVVGDAAAAVLIADGHHPRYEGTLNAVLPPSKIKRPTRRLAQKMLFVGKVVRVLRQANPLSLSSSRPVEPSAAAAWTRESYSGGDTGDIDGEIEGEVEGGDNGLDTGMGMGVIEAEVLELTQRWSELLDRESFHLLALERAVHEVMRCDVWCALRRIPDSSRSIEL